MKDYLDRTKKEFKTLNTIRFENLNRFFKSDRNVLQFCARDKLFKPGSGHFDFIYDLEEKKDQTMKARFDYLEKLPQRKFELSKHSFGCPAWTTLTEQSKREEIKYVLIVELIDVNDKLDHDEIIDRHDVPKDKKEKKIIAYILNPDDDVEVQ